MDTYPATNVKQWHEDLKNVLPTEMVKLEGFPEVEYYLFDFEEVPCDALVQVLSVDDPGEGVLPIIKVSDKLPANERPYYALHEYLEFHNNRLAEDSRLREPATCAEIEELVLGLVPESERASFVAGRIRMYTFLADNGLINPAMQESLDYLNGVNLN